MRARENPFRSECVGSLPFRFLQGSLESLLERLQQQDYRGAIVGVHGSGKTTLFEELQRQLTGRGEKISTVRFTEFQRSTLSRELEQWLEKTEASEILMLDGAEQLSTAQWRRVVQRSQHCRGLLITAHQPGLLPTVYECRTDAELLAELISELIIIDQVPIDLREFGGLLNTHRGNIRDVFREMYDRMS
ncbi:hypothetical protein SH661x_001371 [Planctomicrobium sp. SH661]|uniref:hypothetical protein n=1 Tax=Planctomicrobium sp. SH661 TaxID=3448124 RepID=UPI003F5BDC66